MRSLREHRKEKAYQRAVELARAGGVIRSEDDLLDYRVCRLVEDYAQASIPKKRPVREALASIGRVAGSITSLAVGLYTGLDDRMVQDLSYAGRVFVDNGTVYHYAPPYPPVEQIFCSDPVALIASIALAAGWAAIAVYHAVQYKHREFDRTYLTAKNIQIEYMKRLQAKQIDR